MYSELIYKLNQVLSLPTTKDINILKNVMKNIEYVTPEDITDIETLCNKYFEYDSSDIAFYMCICVLSVIEYIKEPSTERKRNTVYELDYAFDLYNSITKY